MSAAYRYLNNLAYRNPSFFAFYAALGKDLRRRQKQAAKFLMNLLVVLALLVTPFGSLTPSVAHPYYDFSGTPPNEGKEVPSEPLGGVRSDELFGGCNPSEMLNTSDCGDPIKTATGNFWETFTDLSIPGRGGGLHLSRTYNSMNIGSSPGPLGFGWTFNYNMYAGRGLSTWTVVQENSSALHFDTGPWQQDAHVLASWNGSVLTRKQGQMRYYFTNYADPCCGIYGIWRLSQIVDRNAYTTTLTYEPVPGQPSSVVRLHSVTDPSSRSLVFSYGDSSRPKLITGVSDPLSRTVGFGYDSLSNLTVVTDVNGLTTSFAYDTNHRLQTITRPDGATVTNEYDSYGRVLTQTLPLNRRVQLGYSGAPASGFCNPVTTRVTDTLGLVSVYEHGPGCQLSRVTYNATAPQAQQSVWQYAYNDPVDYTSVTSVTDPLSNTWGFTWGKDYSNPYYAKSNGNLLSITDPLSRTASFTYTTQNDLWIMTNTVGLTTTFQYDANGNVLSVKRKDVENNQNVTTSFTYDTTTGRAGDLITVTNALGKQWGMRYDQYGYPSSAFNPLSETSVFTHNNIGWLTEVRNPRGFTSKAEYNTYGNPTVVTDTRGLTTTFNYDDNQNLRTVTDANYKTITYTYNLNDEVTRITRPDNTYSSYDYDGLGRVITQTNSLGQSLRYIYDDINRRATVTDPLKRENSIAYDLAGNPAVITDATGLTITLGYDAAYQLLSVDYKDIGTPDVQYAYNNLGLRSVMTDGVGTTTYSYDSLDRLTSVTDGNQNTVSYGYDIVSRPITLTYPNVGTGTRQVVYGYNDANRMTSVRDWLNNTTQFGYDANGNLTGITYPSGTNLTTTLAYNQADQLTSIAHNHQGSAFLRFDQQPDNVGVMDAITDTRGATTNVNDYLYDDLYRLEGHDLSGASTISRTYDYDAATQIVGTTRLQGGTNTVTTRSYDSANQLKSLEEKVGGITTHNISFTFDKRGNRTQQTDSVGSQSASYTYNQANRLVAYNALYEYAYNGDGLRMSKNWGLNHNRRPYTWDIGVLGGGLPLLLQDKGSSFVYGPGGLLVEQVIDDGVSQSAYYYHTDHLGSVRALTNSAGTVVNEYDYDAYGNVTSQAGTTYNPFGYTGEYTDSESGLVYLRARYYDPQTQQFITADPALAWTGQPYAYVGGSPTYYTDPSGNCPWCIIGAVAGGIAGGVVYGLNCGNNCNWGDAALAVGGGALVGGTLGLAAEIAAPVVTYGAARLGIGAVSAAGTSPWLKSVWQRGVDIENLFGRSPQLVQNFPVIDRFAGGVATSIKSIDLGARTYQNLNRLQSTVQGYCNTMSNYTGQPTKWGGVSIQSAQITGRAVELGIPRTITYGQWKVLLESQRYAGNLLNPVDLIIRVVR